MEKVVADIFEIASEPLNFVGENVFSQSLKALSFVEVEYLPVEIELRLGKITSDGFDSRSSPRLVSILLEKMPTIGEVSIEKYIVNRFTQKGLSTAHDLAGKFLWAREKVKLSSADFLMLNCPWDLRLCSSMEIPVKKAPVPTESSHSFLRTRHSVILGKWRVDLGTDVCLFSRKETFSIEVELVDPVHYDHTSFFHEAQFLCLQLKELVEPGGPLPQISTMTQFDPFR